MLKKRTQNLKEFIYAVIPSNSDNPYNFRIVDAEES